jgi:hypothetical protein
MFLTELAPAFQKLIQQPVAFASGFVTGVLHLNLNEDPLAQWLEKQGYNSANNNSTMSTNGDRNSDKTRPHSIDID